MSRKALAKQKRLRWRTKPKASPKLQKTAISVSTAAANKTMTVATSNDKMPMRMLGARANTLGCSTGPVLGVTLLLKGESPFVLHKVGNLAMIGYLCSWL